MFALKKDSAPISIMLGNASILSANVINVLGALFNSKMQWSNHISQAIFKSNKALNGLRRFFSIKELIQLLTSNFFSIFYYNSEV
jgi:hypothetical protein